MRELPGEPGCPSHLLTSWGRLCWCAIGEDHDEHAFAVDEDDLGDPHPHLPHPPDQEDQDMTDVTAKVVVSKLEPLNEGTTYEAVSLGFAADYADDRNKEWAVATPVISLGMTVKPEVAKHFRMGQAFTLTFTPEV